MLNATFTVEDFKVSAKRHYSANDIVPEEVKNELLHWRDVFSLGRWRIGDITNDLIMKNAQTGMSVTQQQIEDAIGEFCDKSGRTVRYYAETCAFFSQEVRQEFEVVPFSHFVMARSFGEEEWRDVLTLSKLYPNKSAEYVKAQYLIQRAQAKYDDYVLEANDRRIEDLFGDKIKICETSHDLEEPEYPSEYNPLRRVFQHLSSVSDLITCVEDILSEAEKYQLSPLVRDEVNHALDTIRHRLPEITACIRRSTVVQ